MSNVRVYCDIDGLEDNWIEVSGKWTRAEFKAYIESDVAEFWEWWQRKVVNCHLLSEGDEYVTDPAAMNEELLDRIDLRIVGFVGAAITRACSHLRNLGNASARVSLNGVAATQTPAPPHPKN